MNKIEKLETSVNYVYGMMSPQSKYVDRYQSFFTFFGYFSVNHKFRLDIQRPLVAQKLLHDCLSINSTNSGEIVIMYVIID